MTGRVKLGIGLAAVVIFLGIKACGEPYEGAKDVVEEFMEEIREMEGRDALKYLHPTYRDSLAKDLKIPVQFTEMRPSELLACALSTMGEGIEDVEIQEGKMIGENTALVKVKVEDKNEIVKIFNFVLVKEGGKWLIADIGPYVPQTFK